MRGRESVRTCGVPGHAPPPLPWDNRDPIRTLPTRYTQPLWLPGSKTTRPYEGSQQKVIDLVVTRMPTGTLPASQSMAAVLRDVGAADAGVGVHQRRTQT